MDPFQICSHPISNSLFFFFKGSESMKFYTPLLVRDEKVDKTPTSSIGVVFSGWKRNGPSDFHPKTSGWYIVWVGVSFVEPLSSTDDFLRVFWVDEICFTRIFLGYIYGQHHENIYETSSFPVNLLGVMHHFERHIISTAETVQRGKQEKLMSPPLWKLKEFLKWNSTQYDSMWKTWFK